MSLLGGCTREREVAELVERGQWPLACPKDLRDHVADCRVCAEVVVVKQALQRERADAMVQPVLPSASALWWRAQLRRRNEALEKIARPILGAEIFAIVMLAVVGLCGLGWEWRRGIDWRAWIASIHLDALRPTSLTNFGGGLWFVVPVLAALAVVSGLVVYFVSEKQ